MRNSYSNGFLVRTDNPNPTYMDSYTSKVFTYENGLKKTESELGRDGIVFSKRIYFYTTDVLDSVEYYSSMGGDEKLKYSRTYYYQYDKKGKLVKTSLKNQYGNFYNESFYEYNNGLLTASCNFLNSCTKYIYSSRGKVIKMYSTFSTGREELREEYKYDGDILVEKLTYFYPAYDPGNEIDIEKTQYIYE